MYLWLGLLLCVVVGVLVAIQSYIPRLFFKRKRRRKKKVKIKSIKELAKDAFCFAVREIADVCIDSDLVCTHFLEGKERRDLFWCVHEMDGLCIDGIVEEYGTRQIRVTITLVAGLDVDFSGRACICWAD